jgi:protein TonB
MREKTVKCGFLAAFLALAGCATPPPSPPTPVIEPAPAQARTIPAPEAPKTALTVEGYKKLVAERIAAASNDLFTDPLPEMLKSVVVLNITIDREGNLAHVSVRRSNRFRQLENRAMDSVRMAAPFAKPTWLARSGEDSVSFLETFLFRDDGRFQIHTLVAAR